MPVGVTWSQYLKFFGAAMLSMVAGSQVVHIYYKPLKDMDVYIEKEMKNLNIELDLSDQHNQNTNNVNS